MGEVENNRANLCDYGRSKSDNLIIGSVRTDPRPEDAVGMVFVERAVMKTNASRPYGADLLEAD